MVDDNTFVISPLTAVTNGIIAAAVALGVILMCAFVFRWGNSRQRKEAGSGPIAYAKLLARWATTKPPPPPAVVAGPGERVVERSEVTQLGWLLFALGCIAFPLFNFVCLAVCRRKKQVRPSPNTPGAVWPHRLRIPRPAPSPPSSVPCAARLTRRHHRAFAHRSSSPSSRSR